MDEFIAQIDNEEVTVRVIHYRPAEFGRYDGPPEKCYPDEPAEFEFSLHGPDGRQLHLLENTLSRRDRRRLLEQYEALLAEHALADL